MELIKTNIQGIYTNKTKKGITYYGMFRDPIKKTPKRKKIFVKDKHTSKYSLEAKIELEKYINQLSNNDIQENKIEFVDYTLREISEIYFKSRISKVRRLLKEEFSHLDKEEFENSRIIKTKIYNVSKSSSQYNKNILNMSINNNILQEINKDKLYSNKTLLGEIKIRHVTKRVIKIFIETILSESFLAKKSKFNIISQLKTIFNYCIREEIIDMNNPIINIQMENPNKQRIRYLSYEELKELQETIKDECGVYSNVYLSVYLGILTAARAQTILNIRVKDIDTKNQIIHLTNFKAKNKKYRVSINKEASKWFEKKLFPKYKDRDEYIIKTNRNIENSNSYEPMSKIPKRVLDTMDKLFNKDLDKSNNSDRDFVVNYHTIRRSRATLLVKSKKASIYEAMKLLDHSSVKQTEKYLNLSSDILREAQNQEFNLIF